MNRSGERSQRRDASADRFASDDDDDESQHTFLHISLHQSTVSYLYNTKFIRNVRNKIIFKNKDHKKKNANNKKSKVKNILEN